MAELESQPADAMPESYPPEYQQSDGYPPNNTGLEEIPYGESEDTVAKLAPDKSKWEIGTEVSCIKYKEPAVMREKGMMYGVTGSYTYNGNLPFTLKSEDNYSLKFEGRAAWGRVDYRNSGAIDDIKDYLLELRLLGGYSYLLFNKIKFTPFAGLGYRYLNDDMSGRVSSTNAYGYERESNYVYTPLGAEASVNLKNNWVLGLSGEYDIFWYGRQISRLSDVDPGYNDIRNQQRKGKGIRGSLKLQKRLPGYDVSLEPFVRYWSIKRSNDGDWTYYGTLIGYGVEPKNNSTEVGCKLAVGF